METYTVMMPRSLTAENDAKAAMIGEFHEDIELICRIWSLITMWSSFGIFQPYRNPEQVFSGLESVFSSEETRLLQQQRKEYLNMVEKWCTHSIVNGEKVSDRSPFGELSISIDIGQVVKKKS